jgi:phage tail tape-measure protein
MAGALVGAAAGALGGRMIGVSPVAGAAAGMVAGGAVGYAATSGSGTPRRHYYKDTRGYCYYLDAQGQPQYNYNVRC